jgi:hypothetical protein
VSRVGFGGEGSGFKKNARIVDGRMSALRVEMLPTNIVAHFSRL